jgi:hypothetical protein
MVRLGDPFEEFMMANTARSFASQIMGLSDPPKFQTAHKTLGSQIVSEHEVTSMLGGYISGSCRSLHE